MKILLSLLILGVMTGFLLRKCSSFLHVVDRITNWSIYLLLFLLGISVGMNNNIIQNINTIGMQAIFLTIAAVLGSVIVSWITYLFFFRKRQHEK